MNIQDLILIRGAGDLATGVAIRLHRAGFAVMMTELIQPLAVRRAVSFAEAIYEEKWDVEGVSARAADSDSEALACLQGGMIPVRAAPGLESIHLAYSTLIDARLLKHFAASPPVRHAPFILGLGPGFTPGANCHAAIETQRGHTLGRVYWRESPNADSGQPEGDPRRVLRSPADGYFRAHAEIGEMVTAGQVLAEVSGQPLLAPFEGVLRGILRSGLRIQKGLKVGDVDPRGVREHCFMVSDKALAVGGAALEAVLAWKAKMKDETCNL